LVNRFTSFRDLKIRKKVGEEPKGISDLVRTRYPPVFCLSNFPGMSSDRAGDAENTGETGSVRIFTELAPARQRKN